MAHQSGRALTAAGIQELPQTSLQDGCGSSFFAQRCSRDKGRRFRGDSASAARRFAPPRDGFPSARYGPFTDPRGERGVSLQTGFLLCRHGAAFFFVRKNIAKKTKSCLEFEL